MTSSWPFFVVVGVQAAFNILLVDYFVKECLFILLVKMVRVDNKCCCQTRLLAESESFSKIDLRLYGD